MSSSPDINDSELLDSLVEQKLLSSAQAQLAVADRDVTGMTIVEVLLARRWVSEESLIALRPTLKNSAAQAAVVTQPDPPENSRAELYQQNLKKYRHLMHKILGE